MSVRRVLNWIFVVAATIVLAVCFIFMWVILLEDSSQESTRKYASGLPNVNDASCFRPQRTYRTWVLEDRDGDLMDDQWELRWGFDPTDGSDAELDFDGDGYSNLEEYQSSTEPRTVQYHPGVFEITNLGFDCFYTVSIGRINNDDLFDILIRDADANYIPAIKDFVLIQNLDNSFSLEDAENFQVQFYELRSIQSSMELAELNGDDATDIILLGLSNHIPNVNDQIIFAPSSAEIVGRGINLDVIPYSHRELTSDIIEFFKELDGWISDPEYFEKRATVLAKVPAVYELDWILDETGAPVMERYPLRDNEFPEECDTDQFSCFSVLVDESDVYESSARSRLSIEYSSNPYVIHIFDPYNDPESDDYYVQVISRFQTETAFKVKDYSGFNQDALSLSMSEFGSILTSGVLVYPSEESRAIYEMLESLLGDSVFIQSYMAQIGAGYDIEYDYISDASIIGSIQRVLAFVSDRFIRAPESF